MVRRFLKMAAAGCVAATAITSVPSCADNHETMFIAGVLALTAPDCTAKPDPTGKILAGGIMDLKLTNQYTNFVLVGSQLLASGQPATSTAESNRIQINGADIQLTKSDGTQIDFYSVQASGFINPSASSEPGWGAISVQIIPPAEVAKTIAGMVPAGTSMSITAVIKVYGQTLGLTNVESGPFSYPITITNGGTIVRTVNGTTGLVDCTSIPTNATFVATCYPGEDVTQNPCYDVCAITPTDPVCAKTP